MLLVWYKREFEWSDVLRLWEILWTDYRSSQFHLFVAVAILEKHRDVIMNHLKHFDEILKFINELSGRIDLPTALVRADALFHRFERTVEAVDKHNNFPGPRHPGYAIRLGGLAPKKGKASTASGTDATPTSPNSNSSGPSKQTDAKPDEPQRPKPAKVITPELRALLSRKVIVLDKTQVEDHGGGTS